jgi:type III secretion protein L
MQGKIIKGGVPEDSSGDSNDLNLSSLAKDRQVLKGNVVEALDSAEKIIQEAKNKAEEILEKARQTKEEMLAKAQEEGYEQGLAELNETILKFKSEYGQILSNSEKDLLQLSLKIAERIIGRALDMQPELLLDIIHNALQSIKYQREIRIRVNPEHLPYLKENKMQLYAMLGESKEIEIVEDPLVEGDGCIIDTEIGTIDARLETQLRVIEKFLIKT